MIAAIEMRIDGLDLLCIPAPPELVVEGSPAGQDSLFQDQRYRIISFVELDPGDRIRLKVRHHRTVPFFPGHFFDHREIPSIPVRELRLVYDVPKMRVKK